MKKRCLYCNKVFWEEPSDRKYCNYECYVKDHPDRFSHPETAIKAGKEAKAGEE